MRFVQIFFIIYLCNKGKKVKKIQYLLLIILYIVDILWKKLYNDAITKLVCFLLFYMK